MIYPSFLKQGNIIGVPAPSDGARDETKINRYNNSKKKLEELGYKISLCDNIFNSTKGRSADAKTRAKEFNEIYKSSDVIMCAAGGEFLMECLPYIDFDQIKNNPKFICGFSDPTCIIYPVTTKLDIATLYGNNFSSFGAEKWDESQKDFMDLIEGKRVLFNSYDKYEEEGIRQTGLESYNLTEEVKWMELNDKEYSIEGRIIGGCFDIISMLAGTKYDGINEFNEKYKDDGIIWYFDNCELSMEEVIRVLWKFNELGYFKYAKGVIFGRFGIETTIMDYDVKTCLKDSILNNLDIPVIYDADFSHKAQTIPVINGAIAKIDYKNNKATIEYMLK